MKGVVEKLKAAEKGKAVAKEKKDIQPTAVQLAQERQRKRAQEQQQSTLLAASTKAAGAFSILEAAATGMTPQELYRQQQLKKKELEEQQSMEFIKQIAAEEIKGADAEEILIAQQSSALEALKKKTEDFYARKAEGDKELSAGKRAYLSTRFIRKRPQKIKVVRAYQAQHGKATNLQIEREGIDVVFKMDAVNDKSLGPTEWLEVYKLIKDKTAPTFQPLIKICLDVIRKIKMVEKKYKIKDSLLVLAQQPPPPPPARTSFYHSTNMPPITADATLDTSLPYGAEFVDGQFSEQHQGVYYTNVHGHHRFFRVADLSRASTRFLWDLRKGCIMTANDQRIINIIDQELMKPERKNDPAYIEAKQEAAWD
jgi:hypothetical protein